MSFTHPNPGPRLATLYAVSFAAIGIYLPFFPLWLEHRALGALQIGIILAIPMVVRILVTAPLMSFIDRGIGARQLMVAANLAVAATYALLPFAADAAVIGVLVAALAVAQAPIAPITDLLTLQAVRRHAGLDYGRVRLWGSIGFLGATIGGGSIVGLIEADAAIWLLSALAVLAALLARSAAPDGASAEEQPVEERAPALPGARLPRALWFVIGAAACIQASHAAIYAFGSIHWSERGISSITIGLLWAIGVLAEIIVFAVLGRDVGRGRVALAFVMIGAGSAMFRFAAMALDPPLALVFALQILHAVSFGLTHLGTMAALTRLAPDAARGRAQGLASAAQALAMAGGTVVSGLVFRSTGALVFAVMVPLAAAGFLLAYVAARDLTDQPHSAGEGG